MKTSENVTELFKSLSEAQAAFTTVEKESENPFFKSKYANFTAIVEMLRPILGKNGLSFVQMPSLEGDRMVLVTRICHSSGQWIESSCPIKTQKEDPQSLGSAVTYFRRYALSATLGIATGEGDDDAERGMNRGDERPPEDQIKKLLLGFEKIGVSESQILEKYKSIKTVFDMTYDIYEDLVQIGTAIKKGEQWQKHFKPRNVAKDAK